MRTSIVYILIILTLFVFSKICMGQEQEIEIDFESAPLTDVIKLVVDNTNANIYYNEDIPNQVTWKYKSIKSSQLLDEFKKVMKAMGYVLRDAGRKNTYTIERLDKDAGNSDQVKQVNLINVGLILEMEESDYRKLIGLSRGNGFKTIADYIKSEIIKK